MKKRGLWALVLSAAMIATTLAGCGGGGGYSDDGCRIDDGSGDYESGIQ